MTDTAPAVAREGKRDKFIRLVEPRVERALNAIRVISLLGGKNASNYDFGDTDVERIKAAIEDATAKMVERMSHAPTQVPMPFSIPRDSSCAPIARTPQAPGVD